MEIRLLNSILIRPFWGAYKNLDRFLSFASKTLSVFDGTERTKGDVDPLFVVPADVEINDFNELLDRCGLPVPGIEELRFQPSKEAFACRVVR
ncbi:hypothetical protein EV561_11574 [Rhizobium sp. BK376]|nr:hypothetical protein EV561_11574 [Rhizobium sp. BK376]